MSNYEASNITVLEGLEAVRKRPGMYIGNTGREGLHRCLGEILDNSVDEFMAGHATTARVIVEANGVVTVFDDGRGIPTDMHSKTGLSALETIFTVLHAGGKFDQGNYKFSGGLHGVGASVVNALSTYMQVWVNRDGVYHTVRFEKGKIAKTLVQISEAEFQAEFPEILEKNVWKEAHGTIVRYRPDDTIFETTELSIPELRDALKQAAYLNKGFNIIFENRTEETPTIEEFCFPNGIVTYLEEMASGEELITPIIHVEGGEEVFQLELALTYSKDYSTKFFAFTNGVANPEGGMHVTGYKTAITKLINNYAREKNYFKKETDKFTSEDLLEGVRVVLSIKMVDPQFTSQSKVKLGSTIARTFTDRLVTEQVGTFLEENPAVAQSIVTKAQLALKARLASRAARDNVLRKGVLESMSLPGKLADCSEKDPEKSEIFIVEGDSAGGSAKQGRNRHTQAILPLRGKVLNTERATLDRILNYEGIQNMVIAFGTGIGDKFDIEKLRYHKIIIMTDADVDGAHITTLLLTFLYRYMRHLIDQGFIYMARPPLYKIAVGKESHYVYSDEEKVELVKKIKLEKGITEEVNSAEEAAAQIEQKADLEDQNEQITTQVSTQKRKAKIEIQRYKGLGEMNPEQLWETTMDPSTRLLYQVTIGEAAFADKIFDELMGADVTPRKEFIEENARFVEVEMV